MGQQLTCFSSFNQITFGFCFFQASYLNFCSCHSFVLLSREVFGWCVTGPCTDCITSLCPRGAGWDIPGLCSPRAAAHMLPSFWTPEQSHRQPAPPTTTFHDRCSEVAESQEETFNAHFYKWNRKEKGEYDNRFWRIQSDNLQQKLNFMCNKHLRTSVWIRSFWVICQINPCKKQQAFTDILYCK